MVSVNTILKDIKKYGLTVALFLGLIIGFGIYVKAEKEIDQANDQRVFSIMLGRQLRQSSDDLSQMARAYVVTGNPIYLEYYRDILQIRNGEKSRPKNYWDAYWDFVLAGKMESPNGLDKTPALLELMRQAGFTEKEMLFYSTAKVRSDSLADLESKSFKSVQTKSPDAESPRWKAVKMSYDSAYLRAKAEIMLPINQARILVDKRTADRVLDAKNKATAFRIIICLFIMGLIFTLWRNHIASNIENSEREKAEEALRASEAGLNAIIERALDAVVRMDERGIVTGWNRRAEEVFGWQKQEVLGKRLETLIIPKSFKNAHLRGLARYLETGEEKVLNRRIEILALRRSGEEFPVELSITQVKLGGGIQFTAFIEDITERWRSKQQLEDHNVNLEALVETRTQELSAAKDLAEAANRAKSIFLANMSHELRTPLNSILGYSNLLERDPGQGVESKKKLLTINRAGRHLLTLINNVLEISRIEAGSIVIARVPFDLADFLTSVEELIQVRADDKGLAFVVDHSPDLPAFLEGDANHLKQVLLNLLGNAIKYTDSGRIGLSVNYLNGEIELQVSDTGPGISIEDQERIYQPFYQTAIGIAKAEGTGLGLAISREYTQLMGGKLTLKSQLGQGTVFTLTLPMPEAKAPILNAATTRPVQALAPGQGVYRVLQVDDKVDNRELVQQLLESVGFAVRTAANGKEAVELFQAWEPHFIWMDMRMPGMDGFEATRRIRLLPGGDKVKIVALTASVFEEDRKEILNAGCNDILRKPLDADRFFAVMGDQLGVRYLYADPPEPVHAEVSEKIDLSALPTEIVQELRTAAARLDLKSAREIVERMGTNHPQLANKIRKLVANFQFEKISQLCNTESNGNTDA